LAQTKQSRQQQTLWCF